MRRDPVCDKDVVRKRRKIRPAADQLTPLMRPSAPVTSPVFESYWRFAHERQEVFFRRLEGLEPSWTFDQIIREHRFTNVYRASDRISQYLIQNVIYGYHGSDNDTLFRVLLFKFFNRIDTWELLQSELGELSWQTYSFAAYDRVLMRAMDSGQRIYSAAYIMPACVALSAGRKHRGHLKLIEKMVREGVADRLSSAESMGDAFSILRSYPMLGNFLAYQYLIDLNYSELTNFSEMEFVIPGPGARDGLRKVFLDPGGFDEADLIRWVADRQEQEFEALGVRFRGLWGRRLQLIDCQNVFCEVDKYARVRHPEIIGISGRTRIKQKYSPAKRHVLQSPWYPPKWGLNDRIKLEFPGGAEHVPVVAISV